MEISIKIFITRRLRLNKEVILYLLYQRNKKKKRKKRLEKKKMNYVRRKKNFNVVIKRTNLRKVSTFLN